MVSFEVADMFEPSITAIVKAIQEQKKMASKPVSVRSRLAYIQIIVTHVRAIDGIPCRWLRSKSMAIQSTQGTPRASGLPHFTA